MNHRARVLESGGDMERVEIEFPNPGKVTIYSYGTSNRTIQNFVKTLKQNGVVTVVDVRTRPQSQWFPHFNRRALSETLERSGIGYLWLGDKLGGYPEGYDGDFERYMREDPGGRFSDGMKQLLEIAKKAGGPIVVICSEGDSNKCHRRFIIEHLQPPVKSNL